jgi:hypothetical protein
LGEVLLNPTPWEESQRRGFPWLARCCRTHMMETRVRTGLPHGYMTLGYRRTAADFDTGRGVGEK